jgi:iron complex outermembrane receptor protein/outer membrane receptor for ferrienterochelin and colicins
MLAVLFITVRAGAQVTIQADTTDSSPDSTQVAEGGKEGKGHDLDEIVIISTTRTSESIATLPTRVEVIGDEEVDEKNNMRPANVSMLLHESTGMQVQQTSATSGNASIRLQGLDGRYTQLLKDGYPNFGNFSSGLSILEIPPLDLKQVEIIKGPASTLYGAGAIAGVVNFITRTPTTTPMLHAIINQSHVGQTNLGAFAAGRGKKTGFTMLAAVNRQLPYDVDKDGFTELPKASDFTLHPRLFFYPNERTTISVGNSFTKGERTGGDVDVIEHEVSAGHTYFEKNSTLRNVANLEIIHRLKSNDKISFKSSYSFFKRKIEIPGYVFEGRSDNLFTDLSYLRKKGAHTIIVGGNYIRDNFREEQQSSALLRDFKTTTGGVFAQHTWDALKWFKLESGLRIDGLSYGNSLYDKREVMVLPRISGLAIWNSKLSSRVGAGFGYKTPTLFTEQTESFQYQDLAPLNDVKSERSIGGTADINYRTEVGEALSVSFNQMFFLTHIRNPTVLDADASGNYYFINADNPVQSMGFETNLRLTYKEHYKLFMGYTFLETKAKYLSGQQMLPLTPKHKLNLGLVYEKEEFLKAGLEAYFTDRQYLSDGSRTSSFWELGFMAEKYFGKVSVFVNAENFTDVRQSRYKGVVNGPHTAPYFDEIWTHTEGFVVNGGLKVKL